MKMFGMPDELHALLKDRSAETGEPMTLMLRQALAQYFERPDLMAAHDERIRGRWYVNLFLWDMDSLEASSGPHEIASTGELPQLAARELAEPALEALVSADLYRLRQVLARVQSTSARIPLEGGRIAQIDVHREAPI